MRFSDPAHKVPGDEQACWYVREKGRKRVREKQMILDSGPLREGAFWKSKVVDYGFRMFMLCILYVK